jgi:hypothetical protein
MRSAGSAQSAERNPACAYRCRVSHKKPPPGLRALAGSHSQRVSSRHGIQLWWSGWTLCPVTLLWLTFEDCLPDSCRFANRFRYDHPVVRLGGAIEVFRLRNRESQFSDTAPHARP